VSRQYLDSLERWPATLAPDRRCIADCGTVDSLAVHSDTIDGKVAHVETGRVSGGEPGFQRQPWIVASWELGNGSRVFVNGLAESGALLDTLRRAVNSVRIAER
jgi:hypothetical protein